MCKENEVVLKALEIINSLDCAPVELSIGYTDSKGICHHGLVIKECPPLVISKLQEYGFMLSMSKYGLHVIKYDI